MNLNLGFNLYVVLWTVVGAIVALGATITLKLTSVMDVSWWLILIPLYVLMFTAIFVGIKVHQFLKQQEEMMGAMMGMFGGLDDDEDDDDNSDGTDEISDAVFKDLNAMFGEQTKEK